MSLFWTEKTLIEATGGRVKYGGAIAAAGVCIDSRQIQPDQLFIALPGEQVDGHRFLAMAAEKGAAGAVVSHVPEDAPQDLPLLVVPEVLAALQAMGRYRRQHYAGQVVGITGSVGKTSAKEMLKLALSEYGNAYATQGNYNNHIGVPITLCNLPESADFGVIEMGMNHADEIRFLTHMAKPHVALVTAVEAVHLEFFESVEGIAYAKAEIFEGMEQGVAILPSDNAYLHLLKQQAGLYAKYMIGFGKNRLEGDNGISLQLLETPSGEPITYELNGETRHFRLQTKGAHWPLVGAAVLACIHALELPLAAAEQALAQYREQQGRGELRRVAWPPQGEITVMDDAYNASPVSMRSALQTLSQLPATRHIAVLGEMLELGERSADFHAELAEPIAQYGIDGVITVGKGMEALAEALPNTRHLAHFATAEEASDAFKNHLQSGDAVLFKGSHGSGVYRLVGELRHPVARVSESAGY